MSPAGFNTNTLMTNNVCSMISCHCQNLVLMLQCYSLQGKGWQNKKVLSELFLDWAETLQTQLQKRQLLHTKHFTTNMVISRRRFLMKFDVSDVSVVDYQSLRRSITEKIIWSNPFWSVWYEPGSYTARTHGGWCLCSFPTRENRARVSTKRHWNEENMCQRKRIIEAIDFSCRGIFELTFVFLLQRFF